MPWDSNDATLIHTQGIYILYTLKVSCMLMLIVGGHLKGIATVQVVPFDTWVPMYPRVHKSSSSGIAQISLL